MKKIRLNRRIMEDILSDCQRYDSYPSNEIVCTPIIMKTSCLVDGSAFYIYQKRICFRIGRFNYYGRFRGKAPIEKAFTLEQFMSSFYAILDKESNKYVFKYYSK